MHLCIYQSKRLDLGHIKFDIQWKLTNNRQKLISPSVKLSKIISPKIDLQFTDAVNYVPYCAIYCQ